MTTQVTASGGGPETRKRRGAHAAEKLTAVLGIAAIILLMILSAVIPEPAKFQLQVFQIVLAIGTGAVVAALPGVVSFEGAIRENWRIRGGGAVGIFALVYFINPIEIVNPAAVNPVEVRMDGVAKGNTLATGKVVNSDDQIPITDAKIGFQGRNGKNHILASTDSEGKFSMDFSDIDPDRYPLLLVVEFPSFNGKIVETKQKLRRGEIPLKMDFFASKREILKLSDPPEEARR